MIIQCDTFFDGVTFHPEIYIEIIDGRVELRKEIDRPPTHRFVFAMPTLVDQFVHLQTATTPLPTLHTFDLLHYFLKLMLWNGVSTINDVGNSIDVSINLRDWTSQYLGQNINFSGFRLSGKQLYALFARQIEQATTLINAIDVLQKQSATSIFLDYSFPPHLVPVALEEAIERDLRVMIHCGVPVKETLCQAYWVNLAYRGLRYELGNPADRYIMVLENWCELDPERSPEIYEEAIRQGEAGVGFIPLLGLCRKRAFFEEALNEPYLEQVVPIMPYHRYILKMRNPFAYAMAKRHLYRLSPYEKLNRSRKRNIDQGWQNLSTYLKIAYDHGARIMVGSGSPNTAMVPGHSVFQELRLLNQIGISVEDALRIGVCPNGYSTTNPPLPTIESGKGANLMFLEYDPRKEFERLMTQKEFQLMLNGTWLDRPALAAELKSVIFEVEEQSKVENYA